MNDATRGSPERPAEAAFRLFIRVSGLLGRILQPYFGRFGISGSQWGALRTLYRAEQQGISGLRLTDLVDRLLVRPPSVTGLIDRLHRIGYVDRSPSSTDLRSKEVRLTDSGRAVVERVLQGHSEMIASLMAGLEPAELLQLTQLLGRLADHLDATAEADEARGGHEEEGRPDHEIDTVPAGHTSEG